MSSIRDTAIFEKYLSGQLDADELNDFNHRIANDGKFRESFEQHRHLTGTFRSFHKRKQLRKMPGRTHHELMKENSKVREGIWPNMIWRLISHSYRFTTVSSAAKS